MGQDSHKPVVDAVAVIVGIPEALSDSTGRFVLAGIPAGTLVLEIHAIGYEPSAWRIRFVADQRLEHVFELTALPVQLTPLTIEGETVGKRFADFERRRGAGMGYFITKRDIERTNPTSLVDILATVRGVVQDCRGGICQARMARSQPGCEPQYFLDGQESTPFFARNVPPHDIQGIEIYRGASEIPAEFVGSNSGCGVIVIWTKSSP